MIPSGIQSVTALNLEVAHNHFHEISSILDQWVSTSVGHYFGVAQNGNDKKWGKNENKKQKKWKNTYEIKFCICVFFLNFFLSLSYTYGFKASRN